MNHCDENGEEIVCYYNVNTGEISEVLPEEFELDVLPAGWIEMNGGVEHTMIGYMNIVTR